MILMLKLCNGDIKKDVISINMHVMILILMLVMMNFVNMKMNQNVLEVERVKEVV